MKFDFTKTIRLTFTGTIDAGFFDAIAPLAAQRACRTCDYGDDPACGHEQRAERVCAAPVGAWDCAVVPCLGSCANPGGEGW